MVSLRAAKIADNFTERLRYPYLFLRARNMSGTSGRRRAVDCGIRWAPRRWAPRRWAPTVRTTILRRAAGAGKRALTEYPTARLTLSLGIVVIGGGGGGGGGGTARGDAIRVRPLLSLVAKARARAITCGSFQARSFWTRRAELSGARGCQTRSFIGGVLEFEASQKECSSLLEVIHREASKFSFFHWWIFIQRWASEFYSFSFFVRVLLISKLSFCSESSCFTEGKDVCRLPIRVFVIDRNAYVFFGVTRHSDVHTYTATSWWTCVAHSVEPHMFIIILWVII